MVLKELIAYLQQEDPATVVARGFGCPHSYRGDYADLAFEPRENVTVGEMLADARAALGSTFTGYKGGEYRMGEYTTVWLAPYGDTGEGISPTLLDYMLGKHRTQSQTPQTSRNRPRIVTGSAFALRFLAALGIDGAHCRRLIIDAEATKVLTVHVEYYGDERVLDIQFPDPGDRGAERAPGVCLMHEPVTKAQIDAWVHDHATPPPDELGRLNAALAALLRAGRVGVEVVHDAGGAIIHVTLVARPPERQREAGRASPERRTP